MRRITRTLLLVVALACLLSGVGVAPAAAKPDRLGPPPPTSPARVEDPGRLAALNCAESPFGRVLNIGAESEMMIGFRGTGANNGFLQFDRLDATSPTQLTRQVAWPGAPDTGAQSITQLAGTPADIDADGAIEYVELYTTSSAPTMQVRAHQHDGTVIARDLPHSAQSLLTAATISRDVNAREDVAVAFRSSTGSLNVIVYAIQGVTVSGLWRTALNGRGGANQLAMAVGDFDGDGSRDDIVVAIEQSDNSTQLIVLTPDFTIPPTGAGAEFVNGMREIATLNLGVGRPQGIRVAAGDLNGDNRDEIIYAQEQYEVSTPGVSSGVALRSFSISYNAERTSGTLQLWNSANFSAQTSDLALAAGDTDRDGLAEIVLGYQGYADSRLVIRTLDGEQNPPTIHSSFESTDGQRTVARRLALAVGDMDRDALSDIMAAFIDAGGALQAIRLSDQRAPGLGLLLRGELRDSAGGRANATSIVLGAADSNNDSLKAHYDTVGTSTLACKSVVEPNITAAVFVPPYWQEIQADQDRYGSIGQSVTTAKTNETAFTSTRSHSVSAFFGTGIDVEAASAMVRVTGGYEFSASTTSRGGDTVSKTSSEGWDNTTDSFVVVDNSRYNCYTYQVRIGGADADGATRFCQFVSSAELAPVVDTWDVQFGPITNPDAKQWAPIARDWANLALFRPAGAAQSDGGASAALAVDGVIDGVAANGSVSATAAQQSPWWQIDLGAPQPIQHIRLWNRTDLVCGQAPCSAQLSNFLVMVSDVDPRTISDDPSVLRADARVRTYANPGAAGAVTNFLTLRNNFEPIQGRFVRVQLLGAGSLSLAEVQVFGANHVEPDRYPTSVRDPIPGDGWFLATVYDPASATFREVRTRGNLLWNGADDGVLANKAVGPGAGLPSWSLTQERSTFQTDAESVSHTVKVGVEIEAEAGLLAKVQAGGGYEFSAGITREDVRTISWGSSFEIGGGVEGFPDRINGQLVTWPNVCTYGFQPFYYETTEVSSAGYAHRMLVVDYTVPSNSLDRTEALSVCRQQRQQSPAFGSNVESGAPGSVFSLSASNFAASSPLQIEIKDPDDPAYRTLSQLPTGPDGALSFVLALPDDAPPGLYKVRVSTTQGPGIAQVAPVEMRELQIIVDPAAPYYANRPIGGPTVWLDGSLEISYAVKLPMVVGP